MVEVIATTSYGTPVLMGLEDDSFISNDQETQTSFTSISSSEPQAESLEKILYKQQHMYLQRSISRVSSGSENSSSSDNSHSRRRLPHFVRSLLHPFQCIFPFFQQKQFSGDVDQKLAQLPRCTRRHLRRSRNYLRQYLQYRYLRNMTHPTPTPALLSSPDLTMSPLAKRRKYSLNLDGCLRVIGRKCIIKEQVVIAKQLGIFSDDCVHSKSRASARERAGAAAPPLASSTELISDKAAK